MTPRQQAIEDDRMHCVSEAHGIANLMNAWGSDREFLRSQPSRKWMRGPNGWHSYDPVIQRQIDRKVKA